MNTCTNILAMIWSVWLLRSVFRARRVSLFASWMFVLLANGALAGVSFEPLDGYWLSDGYGYVAEIKSGAMTLYEVTPLSRIVRATYTLQAEPVDPRGTR